jgi:hypothetical protein
MHLFICDIKNDKNKTSHSRSRCAKCATNRRKFWAIPEILTKRKEENLLIVIPIDRFEVMMLERG